MFPEFPSILTLLEKHNHSSLKSLSQVVIFYLGFIDYPVILRFNQHKPLGLILICNVMRGHAVQFLEIRISWEQSSLKVMESRTCWPWKTSELQ